MRLDYSKLGESFFERNVYSESLGANITIEMWLPRQIEINVDGTTGHKWLTAVRISSKGRILREDDAQGSDNFQSIIMGLHAINIYFTHVHEDASWLGMNKGNHGFPEIDIHSHMGVDSGNGL